jgi:hypothetical protein
VKAVFQLTITDGGFDGDICVFSEGKEFREVLLQGMTIPGVLPKKHRGAILNMNGCHWLEPGN